MGCLCVYLIGLVVNQVHHLCEFFIQANTSCTTSYINIKRFPTQLSYLLKCLLMLLAAFLLQSAHGREFLKIVMAAVFLQVLSNKVVLNQGRQSVILQKQHNSSRRGTSSLPKAYFDLLFTLSFFFATAWSVFTVVIQQTLCANFVICDARVIFLHI